MGKIVIFWWKLGKQMFYFPEVPKKKFWVGWGSRGGGEGKSG